MAAAGGHVAGAGPQRRAVHERLPASQAEKAGGGMRRVLHWYWSGLKKLPAFSAGYVVGCLVMAVFMTAPALARATLAMVP